MYTTHNKVSVPAAVCPIKGNIIAQCNAFGMNQVEHSQGVRLKSYQKKLKVNAKGDCDCYYVVMVS